MENGRGCTVERETVRQTLSPVTPGGGLGQFLLEEHVSQSAHEPHGCRESAPPLVTLQFCVLVCEHLAAYSCLVFVLLSSTLGHHDTTVSEISAMQVGMFPAGPTWIVLHWIQCVELRPPATSCQDLQGQAWALARDL